MAAPTLVISANSGYHSIGVTGPINGWTSLQQIYGAVTNSANPTLMTKTGTNTYSITNIGTNTYTQLSISANVGVSFQPNTLLAFSKSSTVGATVTLLYQLENSRTVYNEGFQINFSANSATSTGYFNSNGYHTSSGTVQNPVIYRGMYQWLHYFKNPTRIENVKIIDAAAYGITFMQIATSVAPVVYRNIHIYNETMAQAAGSAGFYFNAGGMYSNLDIDGITVSGRLYGGYIVGSSVKVKNMLITGSYYGGLMIQGGGNVISPAFETSKDDTSFPTGRFQSVVYLENVVIKDFGTVASSTYYGIHNYYNSLTIAKNCTITRNIMNNYAARYGIASFYGSILIQNGNTTISLPADSRRWGYNGTFLRGHELDITVVDQNNAPLNQVAITIIQGSTPSKQHWSGLTNAAGKLLNVYGDLPMFIQKQEISKNVFAHWSNNSAPELHHKLLVSKYGYTNYQQTIYITGSIIRTVTLLPSSSGDATIPYIQIGNGIIL